MTSMTTRKRKRDRNPKNRDSDDDFSDSEEESEEELPYLRQRFQDFALWIRTDWAPSSFFSMFPSHRKSKKGGGKALDFEDKENGDDIQVIDDDVQVIDEVEGDNTDDHLMFNNYITKLEKSNGYRQIHKNRSFPLEDECWKIRPSHAKSRKSPTKSLMDSDYITRSSSDVNHVKVISESVKTNEKYLARKSIHTSHSEAPRSSISRPNQSQASSSVMKCPKKYTIDEVVRLDERLQYKLILEKYSSSFNSINLLSSIPVSPVSFKTVANPITCEEQRVKILKELKIDDCERSYKEEFGNPKAKLAKNKPLEITIDDDSDDDELKIIGDIKPPPVRHHYSHPKMHYSQDWFDAMRSQLAIQAEKQIKIVEDQERTLSKYRKERLHKKLLGDVSVFEPAIVDEPEFPELTPEMEDEIDYILGPGDQNEIICKGPPLTGDPIRRMDLVTLKPNAWLNDSILNSYLDLLLERNKTEKGLPSLYSFNTYFYSNLKAKKYPSVRRWTRKVDIFSYDLNLVPMHLTMHWSLAVIDHRIKRIFYYDSMGNSESCVFDILQEYLKLEHQNKKNTPLESPYSFETVSNIPQQLNGTDCGMFTLKYAEYVSRDARITFSQKNMDYFRRRMVWEIKHLTLL